MGTFINTQEQLPGPQEVMYGLGQFGNDERKLQVLLAFDRAKIPLSHSMITNELSAMAGQQMSGYARSVQTFADRGLRNAGAVEPAIAEVMNVVSQKIEFVPGHIITPAGSEFWTAFAGSLLEWSWRHPETSLRQLIGGSNNQRRRTDPPLKYSILRDLVALSEDETMAMSDLVETEGATRNRNTTFSAVSRLADFGAVNKVSNKDGNLREFRIISPDYVMGPVHRPFESLKPETQLLFSALKIASVAKEVWSIDSFITLMETMRPDIEPATLRRARTILHIALAPSGNRLKSNIADVSGKQWDDGDSLVSLDGKFRQAVSDLVEIVEGISSGEKDPLEEGRYKAMQITSNPEMFAALYLKAHENSTVANTDPDAETAIITIIKGLGGTATSRVIREEYVSESGRNVTIGTIFRYLANLIQEEKVIAKRVPASMRDQSPTALYHIV